MKPCKGKSRLDDQEIRQAAIIIKNGGVVAVPTETYYGLAADPENERALRRLFELKQRHESKPILILVSSLEQLEMYVEYIPPQYETLIKRFWPGPLTLVFPAKDSLSEVLTGGTGTVGIRLTPHPVAVNIIETLGRPITATSANISGHDPARSAEQIMMMFGDKLDYIVDCGMSVETLPSTVVKIESGRVCVVRPGLIDIS